jgi:RNA polymerase primary sigma factor
VRRIETLAADSVTLQSYLRQIAKFPRLTSEQERELGRRIQQLADVDALGTLVESNLSFVVSYATRYRKLGVPFLDLIHEGNLGLLEGARRFDPERSETFITHAAWWVRQSIMYSLSDTAGPAVLQVQLEHAPVPFEGPCDLESLVDDPTVVVDDRFTPGERDRNRARREQEIELADGLPDFMLQEIEDDLMRDALVQQLESAMTELTPNERQVIRFRYGLHMTEAVPIHQIAARMQLTRQHVRTIEARGMQKLRRGKALRSYLN